MVDEYQDINHIQERMLELLSNGHNRFYGGDIKHLSFPSGRPAIFNEKFQRYAQNHQEGKSFSSRKISVVVQKAVKPMMSLNVSWTKRSAKSTVITCTSLFFANTKLTPNPDNKAEFLLYDKDDTVRKKRVKQNETNRRNALSYQGDP